jgi:hypothetical protein
MARRYRESAASVSAAVMARFRLVRRHPFLLIPPLFYSHTVCRSLGFGDTAIMIDAMRQGLVDSQVNTHALSILAGMLFQSLPVGEYAFRANLISVFFGSLAVMVFYGAIFAQYGSRLVAGLVAAFLMISHSMWWHSTLVENYAASALITSVCLYLWTRFGSTGREVFLLLLCFTAGLGLLNHVQLAFLCVGAAITGIHYAWPMGAAQRASILLRCFFAALAGLLPWLLLILRDVSRSGSLSLTLRNAFVGNFSGTFFSGAVLPSLGDTAYLFWFQSPTPYLLFGLVGLWLTWREDGFRSPMHNGILTFFALNTITFCFYATWDKFAFLLVSFIVFHFYCGRGLHGVYEWMAARPRWRWGLTASLAAWLAFPPYLYANVATWALDAESPWHWRYNNRYSENLYFQAEYIANPNKRDFREVETFVDRLFARVPPGGIYLDDDSRTYYCVANYYQRYYRRRPDITTLLVNSWGIANWGLGRDTLSDILVRAYFLDKPFFAASVQWPVNEFIQSARRRAPIEFERFPIAEGKWIFRMITSAERTQNEEGPGTLEKSGVFEPLVVSTPSGFFDIAPAHILFFASASPTVQDMRGFAGSRWHGNDQLFFNNDRIGTAVELGLRTDKPRTVVLTLALTAAPDYGVVSVQWLPDGPEEIVDLYSNLVEPTRVELSPYDLRPGLNRIRLTIIDKNPRSSSFKMGIDGIGYKLVGG